MDSLSDTEVAGLQRNAVLSCVSHALLMALFPIATLSLFLTRELGLSMLEVFLLQAVFAFAVAVLELPSGYLADRIGYRVTMMIGAMLGAIGWALYVIATDFATAVTAEVLLALAVSMISGTDTALLYESLRKLGKQGDYTQWFSRMRAAGSAAEGTASLLGAWLFTQGARLPFSVQALIWLGNVVVIAWLKEPARERGPEQRPMERVAMIARFAVAGSPRLRAVFGLYLALALPPYLMVWVLPVYIESAGNSAVIIGPVWAAASYVTALGSWLAPSLERRVGMLPLLASCVVLVAFAYVGLSATQASWGYAFYFALCIVRGLQAPMLGREEQDLIPSSDRAALLSIKSLLFRGAFVIAGPLLGTAIDGLGMRPAVLLAGALLTASSLAAWLVFARATRSAPPALAINPS